MDHLAISFMLCFCYFFLLLVFVFFLTIERGGLGNGVNNFREYMLGNFGLGWICSIVLFFLLFGLDQFQSHILLSSVIWSSSWIGSIGSYLEVGFWWL